MPKCKVLFLCTGNSCRSQMAEAIVNFHLGEIWEAVSAGMKLVVTVCDLAAEECPTWLGRGKRLHLSFPDPVLTNDMNDFRKVCSSIDSKNIATLIEYKIKNIITLIPSITAQH